MFMDRCDTVVKEKVKSLSGYTTLEKDDDVLGLMGKHDYWVMAVVMTKLFNMAQREGESDKEFYDRFSMQLKAEIHFGPMIPTMLKGELTSKQEAGRDKLTACLLLQRMDRSKHWKTLEDLNNSFVQGNKDCYPQDMTAVVTLLQNRHDGGANTHEEEVKDGALLTSFAQRSNEHITCWNCGENGH